MIDYRKIFLKELFSKKDTRFMVQLNVYAKENGFFFVVVIPNYMKK